MKEVPIHLLGFGNVGQALARLMEDNDGYRDFGVKLTLHSIFDRGGGIRVGGGAVSEIVAAKRSGRTVTALKGATRTDLPGSLDATGEQAILVDTTITDASTGGPGLAPAREALGRGVSVVFASKGPLVAAYGELTRLAAQSGARVGAAAAVGIPLPGLEVGLPGLRGSRLSRFRGVLNDTTNQILRDLEGGNTLDEAVERARLAGTIEEDPRLDLEGWDAAYKLLILARAFWDPSLSLEDAETRGVSAIGKREIDEARSQRRRIRLIASGERTASGKVRLRTAPESLERDDPLYGLGPGEKGLVFETESMGTITLKSSKGGPSATAACVVKDVLNIATPPRPFY